MTLGQLPKHFSLCLIVILFICLYSPSLEMQLFQDDFFHLERTLTANSFLDFFTPLDGYVYRPIGIQFFYLSLYSLFGLSAFGYHLAIIGLSIVNILLVYWLSLRLGLSRIGTNLTTFIYAVTPVHYMSLYWVAAFYFAFGATWWLLGIHSLLSFLKTHRKRFLVAFGGCYILGVLTNEVVVFLPLLYPLIEFIKTKKISQKRAIIVTLITFVVVFTRLKFASTPEAFDYNLVFDSLSIMATLRWYLLRLLGLPEAVVVAGNFWPMLLLTFFSYVLIVGLVDVNNLVKKGSLWLMLSVWFFLGLGPMLLMPNHLSAYYLEISLIAYAIALGALIGQKNNHHQKLLLMLFMATTYGLSLLSLQFSQQTHWVSRRARLSGQLLSQVSDQCKSEEIVINTGDKFEAEVALSGQRAIKLYCKRDDITLKYFYEH